MPDHYFYQNVKTINYISSFRQKFGFTQDELASLVGCSKNCISNLENGAAPSIRLAAALCAVFNCRLFELFQFSYYEDPLCV